jgi:hypothetical protein
VVNAAQTELRKRLQTPAVVDVGRQRARLTKRLEQIKKQNGWGDMPDAEYLAERDAIRTSLASRGTRQRPDPLVRRLSGTGPGAARGHRGGVSCPARGALPDRHRAGRHPGPQTRLDCLDTARTAVLRETAGVPPRGLKHPPAVR